MAILLVYSTLFMPFSLAFFDTYDEQGSMIVANAVVDCLYLIDLGVSFLTAHYDDQSCLFVTKLRLIFYRQLTSCMFPIDLVSSFPTELILMWLVPQ